MSSPRSRLGQLCAVALIGVVALAPGCRPLSYYLSNTSFTVTGTSGAVTWNQSDLGSSAKGPWSETVTRPKVHISNVVGSNLTIVALEVLPTSISSQFGDTPGNFLHAGQFQPTPAGGTNAGGGNNCGCDLIPLNSELSSGASGSTTLDVQLANLESDFDISTASTPISPSSTTSAPTLANNAGQVGTNGAYEFEVIPLWKNAFNQTNFTGTVDANNLQLTTAAENDDVPSPRAVLNMDVVYNLVGAGASGGSGGGSGGAPLNGGVTPGGGS